MSNFDSAFKIAYIRFRQILIRKPFYFEPFRHTNNAFCALCSLSSSPHIQPNLATKTLNIFDFFKFSCFFFKYFLEFLFSLLTSSNLIISSHRWSSRSLGYQSSIKSSLSLDSNTSFCTLEAILILHPLQIHFCPVFAEAAIDLYLERIRSTYKDSTNDNGVLSIEYDNLHDFTLFINFLDNSLVSGNINHLAICLSKYFLLLLVALVNFINLFAKIISIIFQQTVGI